jgi:predicted ATPase
VLAVQQLVRSLAQTRPLVIVLEDLHWADPSSTELFNRLLPLIDKLPLLLCLVSREEPEAAGWTLVSTARQRLRGSLVELHLGPLTDQDSQALVANLLEIEALPDTVRALILQRTEGNPFFVEEVIRMLIEQSVIVRQGGDWVARGDIESVEIPDILQSLLLARIDRLPREAREALLVAAVIGRQFPVKVLAGGLSASMPEINLPDVHLPDQDLPDQDLPNLVHSHQRAHRMTLTSQLNTLESAGLVRIAQYEPEVEYLFRHALIQDAAYSLLLSTDRTRLHALVGETIERLYAGHLDAYAALLAYHFERAGDRRRAFERPGLVCQPRG